MESLTKPEHQTGFFSAAQRSPPDAIFALTAAYIQDNHVKKVNLGQGAYRDENGQPWVLPCVQKAEEIVRKQDGGLNHEYLPILGNLDFRNEAVRICLGQDLYIYRDQVATCQALSGTGSLHLVAKLIVQCRSPHTKVYIPEPTWSNHSKVFSSAGLSCHVFRYYDFKGKCLDMGSYCKTLHEAEEGSVVILHACAHNPTGCDPTREQWREIGKTMKERGLYPVFDAAYLGFNSGSLQEDAFAIRYFVGELRLEVAICMSFAKSMGLYGERVGCTMICTSSIEEALNCSSVMEQIQRSEISNPPAYGANIAHMVLSNACLLKQWMRDLQTMSERIRYMRQKLYDGLIKYANWYVRVLRLISQRGTGTQRCVIAGTCSFHGRLFITSRSSVDNNVYQDQYHIYIADNSRISIAGLTDDNVDYVAASIAACVREGDKSSP